MRSSTRRFPLVCLGLLAACLGSVIPGLTSRADAGTLSILAARDQEPAAPAPDPGDPGGDNGSDDEGGGSDEEESD